MRNSTIYRLIFLGAIAIMGILVTQTILLYYTWNAQERAFHEKVNIALLNVVKDLEKMGSAVPNYNLIKQVSSNYYVVNINDNIDVNNLDFFLRKEFEAVALQEDFEYGIYDCAGNTMVYGKYVSLANGEKKIEKPSNKLPTYNEYQYYFGVRFPNRNAYIISSLSLTILFMVILFLTIFFFVYSLSVILRQRRLSEMQKDFINNMTHEFKTPISSIGISTEVILGNPIIKQDERLLKYAGIIKDQIIHLNHQVEKVLQLAKIEKENFRLNQEDLHLHQLIQDVTGPYEIKVQEKNGTIVKELHAENDLFLGDRIHTINVLNNLLDNSLKYSDKTPLITIRTESGEGKLILSITDNGIGIATENIPKLFSKFYRVPTGNLHDVKGFGLGLFYVKNICDAHKWKIQVESEPGKGTTFTIRIPARKSS